MNILTKSKENVTDLNKNPNENQQNNFIYVESSKSKSKGSNQSEDKFSPKISNILSRENYFLKHYIFNFLKALKKIQ